MNMVKKLTLGILVFVVLATALPVLAQNFSNPVLLSGGFPGNNTYPGICENDRGEALAIWRSGNNRGMLYAYYSNGSWSRPEQIPHQLLLLGKYLGSDIVSDSQGRFHVVWEIMEKDVYYGSFSNGGWSTIKVVDFPGKYDGWQLNLDIRSNDELVICGTSKIGQAKEIYVGFMKPGETKFSRFINVSDDPDMSSGSGVTAVDENDHLWVTWKMEVTVGGKEVLETALAHFDDKNKFIDFFRVNREQEHWAFMQWIAHSKQDRLMVVWWWRDRFFSRWQDIPSKTWSPITEIGVKHDRKKDFSMWSKVVSHGKDFYFLAKDTGYRLKLVRFNGETEKWDAPMDIKGSIEQKVFYFDIFPGYDSILITWGTYDDPTQIYTSSYSVTPAIRVLSAENVTVTSLWERSFFGGYRFNRITWVNSPFNEQHGIFLDHFNLYRKKKTEERYPAIPYVSSIPAASLSYEDTEIEGDVYDYYVTAVTRINDKEVESRIVY